MSLYFILDDNDNPVPAELLEWAKWDRAGRRRVAETNLGPLGRVSTVFLGLDHGYPGMFGEFDPLLYKPVLWETMCFGGPFDQHQWRYTSAEEARADHARIVSELTAPGMMVQYRALKGIRRPEQFTRWSEPREEREYTPKSLEEISKSLRNATKAMDRMLRMQRHNRRFRKD